MSDNTALVILVGMFMVMVIVSEWNNRRTK